MNPRFYPTRLLVLAYNRPLIKLITTKPIHGQQDANFRRPTGQYVTLSHRWGDTKGMFCLTKKNIDVFRSTGIPLRELPHTFQDAVRFASLLSPSVRYIWIDSLCIIQNDKADWLLESAQMNQVYSNSYCNLSATCAVSSDYGLFCRRDPQHLWDEEISINIKEMVSPESTESYSLGSNGALIQRCKIVDPKHWEKLVEGATVNTRAWVLQERLLAPRVIHFCEDQIAWECRELDASETSVHGIPDVELKFGEVIEEGRIRLKALLPQQYGQQRSLPLEDDAEQAQENWNLIMERYSRTNLTNPKDKLIALAGIAEQMYSQIVAPYVAGLWQTKYFARQLLWRVEPLWQSPKFEHPSRRPAGFRAPSFSWAAIDAPQGIRCGEIQEEQRLLIKVIQVEIRPEDHFNNQFGLVQKGGFIVIECQKLPIIISKKSRRTPEGLREDVFTWKLDRGRARDARMYPNVYLDSPEDDFEHISGKHSRPSTWLIPAYKNDYGDLIGLLLQQESDHPPRFQRIGLSIIPRYVSSEEEIMSGTSVDENGEFKSVGKEVIQIV